MIYSIGVRTSNTTTNNAAFTIYTGSAAIARVYEITITMAAATASVFGIGFPAVAGITPTSPVLLQTEESGPASTVNSALAWSTSPTNPNVFLRRVNLPATIGVGRTITFPQGLIVPISTNLVIQNIGTTGAADIEIVLDE